MENNTKPTFYNMIYIKMNETEYETRRNCK